MGFQAFMGGGDQFADGVGLGHQLIGIGAAVRADGHGLPCPT